MSGTVVYIGHVSRDHIVIGKQPPEVRAGGGVFFGAVALGKLGSKCQVLTKCSKEDLNLFQPAFSKADVQVSYIADANSTCCENAYPEPKNPDKRLQRFLSLAEPFTAEELDSFFSTNVKNTKVDCVVVNALWYGEFPEYLLANVRKRCTFVVLDAQGMLRHVKKDGSMELKDWAGKKKYLKRIDLLKIDSAEAKILTGTADILKASRILGAAGAPAVLGTEARGVHYYDHTLMRHHFAAFGKYRAEGRTGRGDTVTAAFLQARLNGWAPQAALNIAAAIGTVKMQYPGPFRGMQAAL